jgi:hypothetical protein
MKPIIIVLLILFVFCLCASVGYQLATRSAPDSPTATPAFEPTFAEVIPGVGGEEHSIAVIQVDQLDAELPRLETVWFVSVFFMEDASPTVTFVRLYAPFAVSENARALEQAFSLTSGGEPSGDFWDTLADFDVQIEGYFLVDRFSTQYILGWANGPGDYAPTLLEQEGPRALVQQTCQSITGISLRETTPFEWTGIAPRHFRSNLRMEKAVDIWKKMTSEQALRCDLIVLP